MNVGAVFLTICGVLAAGTLASRRLARLRLAAGLANPRMSPVSQRLRKLRVAEAELTVQALERFELSYNGCHRPSRRLTQASI